MNISQADSNTEVLKNMQKFQVKLKIRFKKITNGLVREYGKDYMKIKFDSDDDLLMNKILKFRILTIIIKNICKKDGKYYPQTFLDDRLYEIEMLEYERIDISEGIGINKTNKSKECDLYCYWYFLDKNL